MFKRSHWELYHHLLTQERFPGHEQRVIWDTIDKYHGGCEPDGLSDLDVDVLQRLVPDDPVYAAFVRSLAPTSDVSDRVVNQIVRRFLRESAAVTLGASALDWAKSAPEKKDKAYTQILDAAKQMVDMEDNEVGSPVEPVSVGGIADLKQDRIPRIAIGFSPSIDRAMGGGAPIGKLGGVMAPLGVGKTLCLTNIGAQAVLRGQNVNHFSLEMDAQTITRWYYSILTGIPFVELDQREDEALAGYKEEWGDILVYDYSGTYCSIGTIERMVRRGSAGVIRDARRPGTGTGPSLLLLDYLALCDRKHGTDGDYASLGADCRRLRKLAVGHNLAIITAVQANRRAMEAGRTEVHHVADSIEIPRVLDWMLLLSQNEHERMGYYMHVKMGKNRFGFDKHEGRWIQDSKTLRLSEFGCEYVWGMSRATTTKPNLGLV